LYGSISPATIGKCVLVNSFRSSFPAHDTCLSEHGAVALKFDRFYMDSAGSNFVNRSAVRAGRILLLRWTGPCSHRSFHSEVESVGVDVAVADVHRQAFLIAVWSAAAHVAFFMTIAGQPSSSSVVTSSPDSQASHSLVQMAHHSKKRRRKGGDHAPFRFRSLTGLPSCGSTRRGRASEANIER
jgi:hypothetical protein